MVWIRADVGEDEEEDSNPAVAGVGAAGREVIVVIDAQDCTC